MLFLSKHEWKTTVVHNMIIIHLRIICINCPPVIFLLFQAWSLLKYDWSSVSA